MLRPDLSDATAVDCRPQAKASEMTCSGSNRLPGECLAGASEEESVSFEASLKVCGAQRPNGSKRCAASSTAQAEFYKPLAALAR